MQSTQPPDQLEPKGWWCWLFLTLMTSTNQSFDSVYFTLILCWILPCSSLLMNMHPPPKPLHEHTYIYPQLQFSSSVVSDTLCDPMDCSTPGFPAHHQLPELAQTHVHPVSDTIPPSHPLSSPSHPALNLSQHQGLFQWVSSSHQVARVLEFQFQHQSFQWIFRTDFL